MTFNNNSFTIISEFWFIPLDIVMITCLILAVLLGCFFLLIMILDRTCHTLPMMLIANSCLSQTMFAGNVLVMYLFAFHNDLKQLYYEDSFCIFRGYLSYALCAAMNNSFFLQSIYRYVIVVYPNCLFCQSIRFQLLLICVMWIFSFSYPLGFLSPGEIVYNSDNQICQIPLGFSFSLILMVLCSYLIPVLLIQLVYLKLVRYVKGMSKRVTPTKNLFRVRKELKMVRRIVVITTILVALGLPYTFFILTSFFTDPPKYHFRIASITINSSLVFVIMALFQFTDSVKSSILKRINQRPETVQLTVTFAKKTLKMDSE